MKRAAGGPVVGLILRDGLFMAVAPMGRKESTRPTIKPSKRAAVRRSERARGVIILLVVVLLFVWSCVSGVPAINGGGALLAAASAADAVLVVLVVCLAKEERVWEGHAHKVVALSSFSSFFLLRFLARGNRGDGRDEGSWCLRSWLSS